MKLEDQVCTLEQAKRLKELGVEQNSIWHYDSDIALFRPDEAIQLSSNCKRNYKCFSLYTVAELGVMLPSIIGCKNDLDDDYFINIHKGRNGWHIQYVTNKKDLAVMSDGNLDRPKSYLHNTYRVDYNLSCAMAKFLIMLLESKTIKVEEVNERLKQ